MTSKNFLAAIFMVLFAVGGIAKAEEAKTATDANTTKTTMPAPAAKRADTDDEIKNARLRASTGSKSLFSFRSEFNYNAGSLQNPISNTRPVLSRGQINPTPVKVFGRISAKYRIADKDSLSAGTGVGWLNPGNVGEAGRVEDPYLTYTRLFAFAGLQNATELTVTKWTSQAEADDNKNVAETDLSHTVIWAVPKTGLQLGVAFDWSREFYSETIGSGKGQPLNTIAAYPFVEYEFNKTFAFRTVLRNMEYYNTLSDRGTYNIKTPTQSVGLGITITRDIYLYPNVQFVWENISAQRSNVALNSYINLF